MNNLKKFATEAEYTAATLNYPAVSWVTSGDTVHFDRTAPVVNDKIMIASVSHDTETITMTLYNAYGTSPSTYFSSITVDDVAVEPITATIQYTATFGAVYVIKYGITTTTVGDCFSTIVGLSSSAQGEIEILIPSQITVINDMPLNKKTALVMESATPPTIQDTFFSALNLDENGKIYVPDEAVNTYKAATYWSDFSYHIYPISEYSGNLPI